MTKRKRSMMETETAVVVDCETAASTAEEDQVFASLRTNLAEINKCKGVIGYILRDATSAIIDLKDSAKLIECAILSYRALDSGEEISELFSLGHIENVLIEGKDIKALCMATGDNKIGIFMEKDVDHADILRRVLP
jgi:predicted regulator of Ras-like GTPase activity (Roadblock/LC7/MglB family)